MAKCSDGREHLVTLALPLSLTLAGALGEAITDAAESVGYTDVVLEAGTNRVLARKVVSSDE